MAYTKQTWTNGDSSTPLSAERLNHIEDGIAAAAAIKGEKGQDGKDGKDGAKGADGKDATPQFTADEVTKIKDLIAEPAGE